MVARLTVTRGISACGKSTWAREEATRRRVSGRRVAVVERDALRDMVGVDYYGDTEGELDVTNGQQVLILGWLVSGVDVIAADTNLRIESVAFLEGIAREAGAEFDVVSFSFVPLEVCIARDATRPPRIPGRCANAQIGAEAVREQYRQLQVDLTVEGLLGSFSRWYGEAEPAGA